MIALGERMSFWIGLMVDTNYVFNNLDWFNPVNWDAGVPTVSDNANVVGDPSRVVLISNGIAEATNVASSVRVYLQDSATLDVRDTLNNSQYIVFDTGINEIKAGKLSGIGGFFGPLSPNPTNYGSLVVGGDNSDSSYGGSISFGIQLTKIGSGTLELSGSNSFSLGTFLEGGTLVLGQSAAAGSGNVVFSLNGSPEVLRLDFTGIFSPAIYNFTAEDTLDLNRVNYATGEITSYTSNSGVTTLTATDGTHTVTFTVNDAMLGHRYALIADTDGSSLLTQVASNSAPEGADSTIALSASASHTFAAADFGFSDPNDTPADSLAAVIVTTLPTAGALTLDGAAVTAGQEIDAADIGSLVYTPTPSVTGPAAATFTFQVVDDGGTLGGGEDTDQSANTITFDITATALPPVTGPTAGANNLVGTSGADTISGLAGNDTIVGGQGNDVLFGNQGSDILFGNQGADTIYGGQDNDTVYGGQDADQVFGNRGDDTLYGNKGADFLHGGMGNDTVYGGQDNDTLNGGMGDDVLQGGLGSDTFIFVPGQGNDIITDFSIEEGDVLDLQGQTYALTTAGDGSAALLLSGGGVIILQGVTEAQFSDAYVA